MAKKETPEEKLLRIIEETKKAPSGQVSSVPAPAAVRRNSRLSFKMLQLNSFLVLAAIASLLFFGYQIKSGRDMLLAPIDIAATPVAPAGTVNILMPQAKGVAFYVDQIASRNLFKPYEKPVRSDETGEDGLISRKMAKYKIVGIAWLDLPESATVMLEDSSSGLTRFLREGDKIEDIVVKTIYTDRVVFSYANEEMVIKL